MQIQYVAQTRISITQLSFVKSSIKVFSPLYIKFLNFRSFLSKVCQPVKNCKFIRE